MKHKQSTVKRLLSLLLVAVMTTGVLTACGEDKSSGDKATADSASEPAQADADSASEPAQTDADADAAAAADLANQPAAVFSCDVEKVVAPKEGAEVAQTLKLTSSTEITGTMSADDVTLKGSFENMKVTDVKNDAETITLTVSGVPSFEGAPTLGYVGTMEFAGKYFDSDKVVPANVAVVCMTDEANGSSYFYPLFDSAIDNDGAKELHILLYSYNGDFAEGFGKDKISLDGILKDSQIVSCEKKDKEYELVLNVKADLDKTAFGTITLAAGSLTNNDKEVSYTRDFSVKTIGRVAYQNPKEFTKEQLEQLKNIVHPKKDPSFLDQTFPEIGTLFNLGTSLYGYYGTAMTAYKTIYSMLGAFGIVEIEPSAEEKRHQEIMEALSTISSQIEAMQYDVSDIRAYAVSNKRALEDLTLITLQDNLAHFHEHYDAMVQYTSEIETALKVTNHDAIVALAEEYYSENETGSEMSEADTEKVIKEFGEKICTMKQSNFSTIGQKMQKVEDEYKKAMSYMKNNDANPISRYAQTYQFVDNFSTTSIVAKEAYALDLDTQFDRTLSYLMLLGGEDSQAENIKSFDEAYFPDVVKEATDAQGHPYFYLAKTYTRILGDSLTDFYKSSKCEKFDVLQKEDVTEFVKRMHGRTMEEELKEAGFPENTYKNQSTKFTDKERSESRPNTNIRGIGFNFEKIMANTKGVPSYGNVGDAKKWKNLYEYLWRYGISNWDWAPFFEACKDPSKEFVVITNGVLYNEKSNKNVSCVGYLNKEGGSSMYHDKKGWYACEPMTYLVRITN